MQPPLLPCCPSPRASPPGSPTLAATAADCDACALVADDDFWLRFEEIRPLGRGCFGTVLLVQAREEEESRPLAAKVVVTDDAANALHEAALLRSLCHPNIVTLDGVYASESTVFVVMEAELGGDLSKRAEAEAGGVLSEADAIGPITGVLAALCHLHTRHRIVHRDVKASNILLAADGVTAKIGDFGLAARLPASGRLTSVCGTHDFLAPEMIRTGHGECAGYDCSVDMWAVGLLLHGLLFGSNPFERETDIETLQAILAGEYAPAEHAPPADRAVGLSARHLLASLLHVDPERRASAEDAAAHSWVSGEDQRAQGERAQGDEPVMCSPLGSWRKSRLMERLWARAG